MRDTAANTPYRDLSKPLLALLLGTHPDVGWPRRAVTAFGSGDSPDGFPWLLHRLTAPQPGTGFPFSPRLPQCVMLCVCTCACMRVHACVCVRTCVGMRESDIKGRVSFVKCAFHKLTVTRMSCALSSIKCSDRKVPECEADVFKGRVAHGNDLKPPPAVLKNRRHRRNRKHEHMMCLMIECQ